MQSRAHNLAALAVCLCLVAVSGCADTADSVAAFVSKPWHKKTPEEMLHVKTPEDRAKELAELAKTAPKKTPEEQQRISQELAHEIRQENDPMMRRHLLRTLEAYPTPLAMAVLLAGAKDSDTEVRRVACECLGKRGGPEAVQELTRVANSDSEFDVRIAAIRGLGQSHDKGTLVTLAEAMVDPNPAMQFRAKESLKEVSGRDFGDDVEAWREYAKNDHSHDDQPSLAERILGIFR
jgi:HEAT repeat protein